MCTRIRDDTMPCELCDGEGTVLVRDDSGQVAEVECPCCGGTGLKASAKDVRRQSKQRISSLRPLRKSRLLSGHSSRHGGRFKRPFAVKLPLSMQSPVEDDLALPDVSAGFAGIVRKSVSDFGEADRPDAGPPASDEIARNEYLPSGWVSELESSLDQSMPGGPVRSDFTLTDAQLRVESSLDPELSVGEAFELALEWPGDLPVENVDFPPRPGQLEVDYEADYDIASHLNAPNGSLADSLEYPVDDLEILGDDRGYDVFGCNEEQGLLRPEDDMLGQ